MIRIIGLMLALLAALAACSSDPPRIAQALLSDPVCTRYQLGGSVINHGGGTSFVVLSDGAQQLSITGSNQFTFPDGYCPGTRFRVSVVGQSAGQTCVAQNNTGVMTTAAVTNIQVTCGATATASYTFTPGDAPNYTYNAGPGTPATALNYGSDLISLPSITQGDSTAGTFGLGTFKNTAYDAGGSILRLSPPTGTVPYMLYAGGEHSDPIRALFNYSDTALGTSNVVGICCGIAALEARQINLNGEIGPIGGYDAFVYSGWGNGSSPTYANNVLLSLSSQNLVMANHSYLDYWIYPRNNASWNAITDPYSLYVTLNVVFTDGTDAISGGATDQHGRGLDPATQYASLSLETYNHVHVDLSSFAGKKVDRIDVNFHNDGANGGFRGIIDEINITGVTPNQGTNINALDANWTPQFGHLMGYWNFDGTGPIVQGTSLPGVVGPNITAMNADGMGLTYVDGPIGQGVLLDGVDDWFQLPGNFAATNRSLSFAGWVYVSVPFYDCTSIFAFFNAPRSYYSLTPWCYFTASYSPHRADGDSPDLVMPAFPNDAWTHIVTTFSGTTATVFINGVLWATSNAVTYAPADIPEVFNALGLTSQAGAFRGRFDEFAFWNVALQPNEVMLIYERQRAAASGSFTSRVFDALDVAPWTSIAWTTPEPFGKTMPNGVSETAAGYPSVIAGLENQLALLWHFDETTLGTAPGGADVLDASGSGNHGIYVGALNTDVVLGQPGVVHDTNAVYMGGVNSNAGYAVTTTTFPANLANFSYQVWFKSIVYGGGKLIGFGDTQTHYSYGNDRHIYMIDSGQLYFGIYDNSYETFLTPLPYNDGRWHQAVATLAGSNGRLYVDGQFLGTVTGTPDLYTMYLKAGCDQLGGWPSIDHYCFGGVLDEVAMWTRVLSDQEVLQLYRRGANRLGLQVRVCTQPDCSDGPVWKGPDGTAAMMYSEVENRNGSTILTTSPNMLFTTYSHAGAVSNVQYFQYRAYLESDDRNALCTYDATSAGCSAEISNVTIAPDHYSALGPTFTATSPLPSFGYITKITETYGPGGCTARLGYRLSLDGVAWYFFSNGKWVASNNQVGQLNIAADLSATILAQFSTDVGAGMLHLQGSLRSDGAHACSLSSISVAYMP